MILYRMEQILHAGSATRDITPNWPVVLHGYGSRSRLSEGVDDRVFVGCLAIEQSGDMLIILTFDMIGIQADDARRLAVAVESATGVAHTRIMISCSHTHFAPAISPTVLADPHWGVVEPDPRFVAHVTENAVSAAKEAIAALETIELAVYRGAVPQVAFNRRTVKPDGFVESNLLYPVNNHELTIDPIDDGLTVLAFRRRSGKNILLFNFGCHPVTGGVDRERDFYKISADYIRWVRETVQERQDSDVLFTLGAAGNTVPMNRGGANREYLGSSLAFAALLGERAYLSDTSPGRLAAVTDTIQVESSYRPLDPGDTAYEAARDQLLRSNVENPDDADYQDKLHRAFRSRLYPGGTCTLTIQFMRIGQTVLVALPFEVFARTSMEMKRRYPHAVLVSCANGYEGYLPSVREIQRGGYESEPRSMHFSPGTEERVAALVDKRLASF